MKHDDLLRNKESQIAARIMVALDYATTDEARRLVEQLHGIPCYLKVGMELFYAAGPSFVQELKQRGYRVFLDLKLHDIPNTVQGAARSVTALGVDMFNVHAAGGVKMMQAALAGVEDIAQNSSSSHRPQVIAVTQLTSTSLDTLQQEIGIPLSIEDAVVHYARLAKQAGLQGVVASAQEVELIKEAVDLDFVTVTPGIRPAGFSLDDQARVMTPRQAFTAGSDYIVIGRPITAASDPRLSLHNIIAELMEGE